MKRLILALAGYALYRWLTKPQPVEIAGILPPPRKSPARQRQVRHKPANG